MIEKLNIYHTPQDWDEMVRWVNMHAPNQRIPLMKATGMSWNLACKFAAENEQTEEIRT